MTSLKLGLYALLLEISAWSGVSLLDTGPDARLAWYLTTHLLASALLSFAVSLLLPVSTHRQRLPLFLLMTGFSYAVPIAGFIGVLVGTLLLRAYRSPDIVPEFESVNQYTRWQNMMRDYFRKRTGVTGGQVVAIEPSDISTAFKFDAGAAGEAIR